MLPRARLGTLRLGLAALALLTCGAAWTASAGAAPAKRSATTTKTIKIGWIAGLTGIQATNSASATQGIVAAVEQINKTKAAGNVKLALVTADDAADPQTASQRCNQLVNQHHVQVVIGFESTPAQAACLQYLTSANIPYILAQTSTSGSICAPNYYALATVGNQQVNPLVGYLLKHGTEKIYVVASDFVSSRVTLQQIRDFIGSRATIVGTSFEPLGTTDFSSDISKIAAAKPDTVIDLLVGNDEVAFYKQFRTDPRSSGMKTASPLMDDGVAKAIGQRLLKDTVVNTSYALTNPSKQNRAFIAAVKARFGRKAAISGAAAAAWDGAWILADALKRSHGATGQTLIEALSHSRSIGPRGGLVFNGKHYVSLTMYLVVYNGKTGKIVGDVRNIPPVPANAQCR